jgi:hypothetical protein
VTVATCVQCGEFKFGAWLPCRVCGFQPSTPAEKAKSLLASDHYFSPEYLGRAGEQLRTGHPLLFSEAQVKSLAKGIEKQYYFYLNFQIETGTAFGNFFWPISAV